VAAKTRFFTTVRWLQDLVYVAQRGDRVAVRSSVRRLREDLNDGGV
jgi:hypothetical protein